MSELSRFPEPLHVGRPNIGDRKRLQERIDTALDRRWLSNGPLVLELEETVAALVSTAHCVATCNGTIALQLAARACGIEPGTEVIVPAFTWVATPHALSWIGVTPVFCDVDEETANLSPALVKELIGPATGGILGVHVFEQALRRRRARRHRSRSGLPLMFDAAHGLGSTYHGRPLGGFGSVEVFSFHATKFINSFEGGALVTDDPAIAARARAMRNFGIGEDGLVQSHGTNAKMGEASAAMGLTSLENIDALIAYNTLNHRRYEQGLDGLPGVSVHAAGAGGARQSPVRRHRDRRDGRGHPPGPRPRDSGAPQRPLPPLLPPRLPPSRALPQPPRHPRAAAAAAHRGLSERVLSLPTGSVIGAEEISGVCDIIRWAVESTRTTT